MSAQALRTTRLFLKLTQQVLAQRSGVPTWRISYAERGIQELRLEDQERIAAVFFQYVGADVSRIFPALADGTTPTSPDGSGEAESGQ